MQRKTKLLAGGAAAALLALGAVAGLAHAHMGPGGGFMRMWGMGHGPGLGGQAFVARYDADKSGTVSQDEIDRNRAQWLTDFDADKTGALSLDEFRGLWLKARQEMMVREFQVLDRDGNGQVTLDEYRGPFAGIVAARDTNGDGTLGPDDAPRRRGHMWRERHGEPRDSLDGPEDQAPPPPGEAPPAP